MDLGCESIQQCSDAGEDIINNRCRNNFNDLCAALLEIQHPYLIAQHDTLRLGSGARQGDGEAVFPGKLAALGNRCNQYQTKAVEFRHGQDKHITLSLLLFTQCRIKIEVENVPPIRDTALHSASFPTGWAASQSRSSSVNAMFSSLHCANNSARV